MKICTYVYMHICMCIYVYTYIYVNIYAYIFIFLLHSDESGEPLQDRDLVVMGRVCVCAHV